MATLVQLSQGQWLACAGFFKGVRRERHAKKRACASADVGPQVASGALTNSARSFDARKTRTQDDKHGMTGKEGSPCSAAHTANSFVSSSRQTSRLVILSASVTSIEGSRTCRQSAAGLRSPAENGQSQAERASKKWHRHLACGAGRRRACRASADKWPVSPTAGTAVPLSGRSLKQSRVVRLNQGFLDNGESVFPITSSCRAATFVPIATENPPWPGKISHSECAVLGRKLTVPILPALTSGSAE